MNRIQPALDQRFHYLYLDILLNCVFLIHFDREILVNENMMKWMHSEEKYDIFWYFDSL